MEYLNINATSANYSLQKSVSSKDGQTSVTQSESYEETSVNISAVYEKNEEETSKAVTYKADMEKVKAMKEASDQKMMEMFKETVRSMSGKQFRGLKRFYADHLQNRKVATEATNTTINIEINGEATEVTGRDEIDPALVEQAKLDIEGDGYWSPESVSDRFIEFAKALSGEDPSKIDLLVDAFKQGYEAAKDIWGDELPEISQKTYDLTMEKFETWRNGDEEAN